MINQKTALEIETQRLAACQSLVQLWGDTTEQSWGLAHFGPWKTLSTAQNLDMSHSSFKSSLQLALKKSGDRHFVSPSFQNFWMGKNIDLKYGRPFPC